ncbi:hypothetical protein OROMI_002370 [Orobanche minor]
MERRYDPKVPIEISDDDREIAICSANHKKLKQEIKKIGVKVVKKSNPILKREEEVGEEAVTFKIEIDIPLRWVMIGYCQKLGLDFQTTRFEFNGAKLREMDTPHQLAMVHDDVIFAFPIPGGYGYSAVHYVTLCIRMHKEKDYFVRVRRFTAILPQLMRHFPNTGPQEQGSLCFVYSGLELAQNHIANELNMKDGDIIDGFNFYMSSSLSMVRPHITLKVRCISGNDTLFTVTHSTRLGQLMDRLVPPGSNLSRSDIRFIFDGRALKETQTVEEVQLKDGDEIYSHFCLRGC